MVLGAHLGVEAIPAAWGPGHFVEWEHSEELLAGAPLLRGAPATVESAADREL
jgi:hypothetical protein